MGFWGIEVKPGQPYPYHSDDVPGRLHITQATLGLGSSEEKSIVQCTIGHKSPVFLCSLLPNRNESCSLNLEFDEDDLVAFSVIGPRSVHLSGYFEADEEDGIRDDYGSDLYGEDVAESESGDSDSSDEFDTSDEYANEFSVSDDDDDFDLCDSPVRKSGVVIEEIVDEPENGSSQSKQTKNKKKKKNEPSVSVEGKESQQQIVVRGRSGVAVLESEDEDGFPISDKKSVKDDKKKNTQVGGDDSSKLKRKVENTNEEGRPEKKKKNKNKKQPEKQAVDGDCNEKQSSEDFEKQSDEKSVDDEKTQIQIQSDDKKQKKKNKKKVKANEEGTTTDQTVSAKEGQKKPSVNTEKKQGEGQKKPSVNTEKKQADETKPSQVRTFPNGLVIEEVSMGKPDGKRASPGKTVFVRYIGKLQKNGKIFDSNIGKSPFKFRLGTGMVISGWDVGVNGMRVGDKRRLTIPPEMGYGSKGAGGLIPPNAWLMFDVELVDVR